jgi:hypothetical protein
MKFEIPKKLQPIFCLPTEDRNRFAFMILLGVWALLNYLMGNRFYGLLIAAFFLILVTVRRPSFLLVAFSVLMIVLFTTPMLDAWIKLSESNLNTIEHPKKTLYIIFTPNTGKEVLPPQAQQILSMAKTNRISSYQLSNELNMTGYLKQRIIESTWPIKIEKTSSYLFINLRELNKYPDCVVIDKEKDVALGYCH